MDVYIILAGVLVGFCVGVTGVGAGSLMTPILILLLKIEPHIAIGTDLLYAAISKFFGGLVHIKKKHVEWSIVLWLALGSVPASIFTNFVLVHYFGGANNFKNILTFALGFMLLITGLSVIFRTQLENLFERYRQTDKNMSKHVPVPTGSLLAMGLLLGILVTLSSVGAGAFGVMALVLMFPQLPMIRIIGSDVTHAVLLTLIAGMGHLFTGNVDFHLLAFLLLGAIPAIIIGTHVSSQLPEKKIRPILGATLFLIGLNFLFNPSQHKQPTQDNLKTQLQVKPFYFAKLT